MTSAPELSEPPVLVQPILVGDRDGVLLTLNRPEKRNPLDVETLALLHDHLREMTVSRDIAAILITGSGGAFSSGGDLKGYQELFGAPSALYAFLLQFQAVCQCLERCEQLTVAALNGVCVAGGLELALACDIITMGDGATVGDGHLRYGQLPGAGSSQRLVRTIGTQRAKHWLLSGRLFSADEAVEAGLAVATFPDASLIQDTIRFASGMAKSSPLARRRVKEMVNIAQSERLDVGLAKERDIAAAYATTSSDGREGLAAFAEGRDPRFSGT